MSGDPQYPHNFVDRDADDEARQTTFGPLEGLEVVDAQVIKPDHYTRFAIEPVTFIMRNDLGFHVGNIIKYICRAGYKIYDGLSDVESEIRDLEKVRRYAEMRINQLNGESEL